MATILRRAAFAFLGLGLTSAAWANSPSDWSLDSVAWDGPTATAAAGVEDVELVNPVQLASNCGP